MIKSKKVLKTIDIKSFLIYYVIRSKILADNHKQKVTQIKKTKGVKDMREITVKNFKGNEFSGMWNEKTYSSHIAEHPEYFRIYVSNEPIHIIPAELDRINGDVEKENFIRERKECENFISKFEKMDIKNKAYILLHIADDEELKRICQDKVFTLNSHGKTRDIDAADVLIKKCFQFLHDKNI